MKEDINWTFDYEEDIDSDNILCIKTYYRMYHTHHDEKNIMFKAGDYYKIKKTIGERVTITGIKCSIDFPRIEDTRKYFDYKGTNIYRDMWDKVIEDINNEEW